MAETQSTKWSKQMATDKALHIEYLELTSTGATMTEALIEAANINELAVCAVFDALRREGFENPCGDLVIA
jgi:hypothetical protein